MKTAWKKKNIQKTIQLAVAFLFLLVWIYPFIATVLNSFKTTRQMMLNFLALPKTLLLDNYIHAWEKINFQYSLMNTIIITVVGVGGIVLISSMAAYKLARTKTRLSKLIFTVFVIPMMVPGQTLMVALVVFANKLHLVGSVLGMTVIYWATASPFTIFLYHGFVNGISTELDESARIDGANAFQTFFRIIFPLLKPIVFTSVILNVIRIWNDFLLPLLFLGGNKYKRTLTVAVYSAFGSTNIDWQLATAGIVLSMIIPMVLFVFFQRYIVDGIAAGAVKA